jgi:hypothetical protein
MRDVEGSSVRDPGCLPHAHTQKKLSTMLSILNKLCRQETQLTEKRRTQLIRNLSPVDRRPFADEPRPARARAQEHAEPDDDELAALQQRALLQLGAEDGGDQGRRHARAHNSTTLAFSTPRDQLEMSKWAAQHGPARARPGTARLGHGPFGPFNRRAVPARH